MNKNPHALILLAQGTNRDHDAAEALRLAGAVPEIIPLNDLREGRKRLRDYQMLVLPGGFSYADALGAGKLLAIDLQVYFLEEVAAFVASGKPVIGICNGFQTLIKSGILPGNIQGKVQKTTLTFNSKGHFECRWVEMKPISQTCIWTRGLDESITCPISHGEGNFQTNDPNMLQQLQGQDQVALIYARPGGRPADGEYPANPNGSVLDIAGICNPNGNVLGLMPHPENHIRPWQNPRWTRGYQSGGGLPLFINGVKFAQDL
jgi:phosphoribosylformylglycinamidine synthase